jgi:hypothetical protein
MTDTAQNVPSGVEAPEPWPEVAKLPGADQEAARAAGMVAQTATEPGRHAPMFTAPGAERPEPRPARGGGLVCAARECRADIYKPLSEKGRTMPVDAEPNDQGNLVWRQGDYGNGKPEWRMHVIAKGERVDPGERRFMPHWKTCTSPEAFRRREKRDTSDAPAVAVLERGGLRPETVKAPPPAPTRRAARVPDPGPMADVVTFITHDPAPSLGEVGADQDEATRTCPGCGEVVAAVMPALWGAAPVLLELERGLYELLAVRVAGEWRVRPVGDTEQQLPFWNRRAAHHCRTSVTPCQTPGHQDRPGSLTAGGVRCSQCRTSR